MNVEAMKRTAAASGDNTVQKAIDGLVELFQICDPRSYNLRITYRIL